MCKKNFPFVLSFISFLFVLSSCNKSNITKNQADVSNQNRVLLKTNDKNDNNIAGDSGKFGKIIGYKEITENGKEKKIPIYDGIPDGIDPKALACDYYSLYVNEFDHYEKKNGKTLGIFNTKEILISATELHNTWGFSGYMKGGQTKTELINIGYDYNNIMISVTINDGQYSLPSDIYYKYYVDEPFEKGTITQSNLINLANAVYSINENASVIMGSYKDTRTYYEQYMAVLSKTANSGMMCDQYYDGTIFYGHDQGSYWDWFKDNYGSAKANSNWIHILVDGIQGDFNMLFDKANSVGLNSLWLFAGDANNCNWYEINGICENLTQSNYNKYLPQFCNSAFQKGWLRKFVKKYKYMYHCPEYYGDPCYCNETDSGWQLAWIQYMGIEEVH